MCSDWRLLAWGSWRQANYEQGILHDWSGGKYWLLLVGPEFEEGEQAKTVVSNPWKSSDHSRLTAADYGLASWALYVDQSSMVVCSLAIVYILSLLGSMFLT